MNDILTDAEVAELLGIKKKTLQNRFSDGANVPPSFRLQGFRKRLYNRDEVLAWIQKEAASNRFYSAGRVR